MWLLLKKFSTTSENEKNAKITGVLPIAASTQVDDPEKRKFHQHYQEN